MKIALIAAIALAATASAAEAQVRVRGYVRSDGTYVAPHVRTAPNGSAYDNWSSQPNINPYTGRTGTVDPTQVYPQYRPLPSLPRLPSLPTYNAPRNTTQPNQQCLYYSPC